MDEINTFIVDLVDDKGLAWGDVYAQVQSRHPELTRSAIRHRYYRHSRKHVIRGSTSVRSGSDAVQRARAEWRRMSRTLEARREQNVTISTDKACIVSIADVHAGNSGVDYDRLFFEAETIAEMPDTYVILAGDMLDQFVIGNLAKVRFGSRMSIPDEWEVVRELLEIIAPKIIVSVAGNHDNWSSYLIGVDYFRDVLSSINDEALYDEHDCRFTLRVGGESGASWRFRVRHLWRGNSQYNVTHAIEKAAKWDQDFDVGIGGHIHRAGLARPFNNAGRTGWAVMCGSYKIYDSYAVKQGFPVRHGGTAVPLVFTKRGTAIYFESLADAAGYMAEG